ncbi:hypothetical protein C8R44DRAFT_657321 [Mycena epipterygia]|nr:hypothetical protein C8R44DRAFT_657321 [Mycena epipterygia]
MKLFRLMLCGMFTAAFAQSIKIGAPVRGSTVHRGSKVVVEVDRPDTLTGSTEVAIVIGFQSCSQYPCSSPMDRIGNILYNGSYDPQFHTGPGLMASPRTRTSRLSFQRMPRPGKHNSVSSTSVWSGPARSRYWRVATSRSW